MINFYKFTFQKKGRHVQCMNYSYSKDNFPSKVELLKLKEEHYYKNFQKIKLNQKEKFTITKKFTLDWHTKPNNNSISEKISKNQRLLKLASFYSQLNCTNFSKKFTSLMILNLKSEIKNSKNVKQKNIEGFRFVSDNKIQKIANFKELKKNNQIFLNLEYKEKVWFPKLFMPFSNRNYWWILLPTRSILTHIRYNIYLNRITDIFRFYQTSITSKDFFNSTILFDFFPEFLTEKPIYWYWMLPFLGCIGLVANNFNLSFFENSYTAYNSKNYVNLNVYLNRSKNEMHNNISWEMFQFFDYKKILFDSSLNYINKLSLNNDNLLIEIKKTWLSRQKEYYTCNYEDNLIRNHFNQSLNQSTKLTNLYWWKMNWEQVKFSSSSNFIESQSSGFLKQNNSNTLLNNFCFNIKKNNLFYSFDSLFYSTFSWYWHSLNTRNPNAIFNFNYSKILSKDSETNIQPFQKSLTNCTSRFFYPFFINSTLSFNSKSDFTINEFPLKIQFSWLLDDLQKTKINLKKNSQTNANFHLLTNKKYNIITYKNKEYSKNRIQFHIKKINFKFQKLLNSIPLKNCYSKTSNDILSDSFFIKLKNITDSKSFFLFCIYSKKQSIINQKKLIEKFQIDQILNNTRISNSSFDNIILKNKNRVFSNLNLYDGIGCEIFESDFNPIYKSNLIEYNNFIIKFNEFNQTSSLILDRMDHFKKNKSISSFNKASFLLNNFLSKFYFESGLSCFTTQCLINSFYEIINLNKYNNALILPSFSNYKKFIQIQKNPIVMSGYNLPHLSSAFQEKNQIKMNEIRCYLPPDIISNQFKLNNFFKYNEQIQELKSHFNYTENNTSILNQTVALIKKQNLCVINSQFSKINSKTKKIQHFLIYNLVKSKLNSTMFESQPTKFKMNRKKMKYKKQFFSIKNNNKYKIIQFDFINQNLFCNEIFNFKDKIFKIKKSSIKLDSKKANQLNSSLLLRSYDSIIKAKISSILRELLILNESKKTFFSSIIFSDSKLLPIKRERKKMNTFLSFNITPKYSYMSNQSIFWNYINATYNTSGLLNTNKPFIFDKFNQFLRKVRMNLVNRKNNNFQGSYYFSNLLLQKYQRKNQNWPGGSDPRGFFYKRINKLNFKQIQKKYNINRSDKRNLNGVEMILNNKLNQIKQLKNISTSKPVAELLWEVRTKHKIPEVLLIQQTLFFQKKLVRKSTEDNNIGNQYSGTDQGVKVQTLLRKMTQRRHFRKHVFIDNLFHWTRDAISLRKMLRKVYLKNNWQIFLKYIFNSKKTTVSSDYYSNWYKKRLDNNEFVKQDFLSNPFNTSFNKNSEKLIKTENIRPFFSKLHQTKNNKKLFEGKNNIYLILKNIYENVPISFELSKNKSKSTKFIHCTCYRYKNQESVSIKNFKILSLRKQNNIKTNPLVLPEWKIFNNRILLNVFTRPQFQKFLEIRDNINFKSSLINNNLLDPSLRILINQVNSNQSHYFSNRQNSYKFINQQHFSKISFPFYNTIFKIENKNNITNSIEFENKKLMNHEKEQTSFSSSLNFNNNFLLIKNKDNNCKTNFQLKHFNSFFNFLNVFHFLPDYSNIKYKVNKFFEINTNYFNFLQKKLLEKDIQKDQLNFDSNNLSVRQRLLYQKIYFANIFWNSTDFVLNTNSTIFKENQIIKNFITQNWVFKTRPIYSHNFFDKELDLNFNNLLATLSTWQSKFQIKRDLILQIFYIYLDHTAAFLNYVIKHLILDNIMNQILNWSFFKEISILPEKEYRKINSLNLEFINQPGWSFNLFSHIKTRYPHLYNHIQIINQSNFSDLQAFNILTRTPQFQSKTEIVISPNFKTQLQLMDSFKINSGRNIEFLKSSNIFSNIYNHSLNIQPIDRSILNKLSSESLIIRNSTLFCQKWIQNRKLSNFLKIEFLKKQQKLRQILNIIKLKNDQIKTDSGKIFFIDTASKRKNFIQNKTISFKRRSGFLFTRSLITRNFNSFSSFSKVTQTSFSVYLNKNLEDISIWNLLFFIQLILLHICLIFCLITIYQSAFHFCLKSFISIFVILIHYFLNIKYRLKRLINYVYQSTIQSSLTTFRESFLSSDSRKVFVFFNNLSTATFYNKFSIWGKIYKSSIPSLTNFLFKNPFFDSNHLKRIFFVSQSKSKHYLISSQKNKKFNNLKYFFDDIKFNEIRNRKELSLNFKLNFIPKRNLLKTVSQKKENNRMSLLRTANFIQKSDFLKLQNDTFFISNQTELVRQTNHILPWEKANLNINKKILLKGLIHNKKIIKTKDSSIFQLSLKLLKWNLGVILLIGESEIFAELEPYREMHWYFLKRLPIFLRSNIYLEDPINMYDYQADEKLRKFKEQFKKSTEIFQKRQNTIERKTERNRKKEHINTSERMESLNSSEIQNFKLMNKKYSTNKNLLITNNQINSDNIILFIKSDKQLKDNSLQIYEYLNKIKLLVTNFDFIRKKISRGQPFWKPLFSFLAYTLFISRLAKLNRRFRDSVLSINYVWIPFGPLNSILYSFLWKNWILNFSTILENQNNIFNKLDRSTKLSKKKDFLNPLYPISKLDFSEIQQSQFKLNQNYNLKTISSYCSPFQVTSFIPNKRNNFEFKQFVYELERIRKNINVQNNVFSQFSPPLLNRVFLWNFIKFEKKYQRAISKWSKLEINKKSKFDLFQLNSESVISKNQRTHTIERVMTKYRSIYVNNQEQSSQNRYIHYQTYDPKVRLYRFYTNFSKNLSAIGIIQDAKNVHPLFGSLLCEINSGLFSSTIRNRTQFEGIYHKSFQRQLSYFSSTKNILLVGNTNSSNFVLLVQAFAAETGLKLFMEDAKRLRRLGRRGINKSTKRLEKLFEIAQAYSPSIVLLEDIDVIGSKRRVTKINEEEDDEDMAIRSFFSKSIYRKQHNYKSLRQSFIHQNFFIINDESYRNIQKPVIPESPIPSNLIEYQLTRRKAFSNYFSNTSNSSYKTFITKFNALKNLTSTPGNNHISSSPTNTVIIWKLLKSKLVTPKKTIKETPWKHIPVDSMRSIPLITYSIRVKVAKLTMLAIYTMNTQLRLVKDLIKLLEKLHYESYKGFIVFATTNKLSILDPSLRRPGRFDETVYLPSLTVNPNYQRFSSIHFLNVLSVDSEDFVNFSRTFNMLNSMNFAIDWNLNSVYGNVLIQDNSERIFYPIKTSLRDLINFTADNIYNQNILMQNDNNIYKNFIPFDILGNIGLQKHHFSIYAKSALLLSLSYSKAGQLIIKLFFQERKCQEQANNINVSNSIEFVPFNSENNQLTIWPNSNILNQFKKINISYNNQNRNIKNSLIYYFAGKIGEYCFFSFYNNQNHFKKNIINLNKKTINIFEKKSFGLRSLHGIQPNWKNMNSVIFSLIRTSCLYSKNHLTSKLFYLDDVFKKRQRIFSENLGPSLLFEYFNLNKESFLKRNTISLDEHLKKQQNQKYLLNLQQKPLRKYLFHSNLNKISIPKTSFKKTDKVQEKNYQRLALFRILFNELGALDSISLRPTAMNYYYDTKISQKQRFRKYTYKWWNWHLKKTIDSLEEFQYLDFFPYADKQYNPRRQRWMLTNGYSAYWLSQEKILYHQIYEQLIIECFQISYLQLDKHREMLDYLVQLLMTKQLLTEIQWILFFKRFT
nr:cell division protein [Oedogonium sp. HN1801B]